MISKIPVIKIMLVISLYNTVHAEPKLDTRTGFGTDIYYKMCSLFKFSKFCLPYIWGAYTYPLLPISGGVLPIAPIPQGPLVINPPSPPPIFTIPTVFTTIRSPASPPAPQIPIPNPGICPLTITLCPPAALSVPIDPRQGIFRSFYFLALARQRYSQK